MPTPKLHFYRKEVNGAHTVVFVHGFKGHYKSSWGAFPRLLSEDSELPVLNIATWGYRTKLLGWWIPSIKKVSRQLRTTLEGLPPNEAVTLFLIGHSMGGLVILRCLVSDMKHGRAEECPCKHVGHIWLLATPLDKTALLKVVKRILKWMYGAEWMLSSQFREMVEGSFLEDLVAGVQHHLYDPTIAPEETAFKRRIALRTHVGTADLLVSFEGTRKVFPEPPPREYDAGHWSIKKPKHHSDPRYKNLKRDLESQLVSEFRRLCQDSLAEEEAIAQEAQGRFRVLYRPMLEREVANRSLGWSENRRSELLRKLEATVWAIGSRKDWTPGYVLGLALPVVLESVRK